MQKLFIQSSVDISFFLEPFVSNIRQPRFNFFEIHRRIERVLTYGLYANITREINLHIDRHDICSLTKTKIDVLDNGTG